MELNSHVGCQKLRLFVTSSNMLAKVEIFFKKHTFCAYWTLKSPYQKKIQKKTEKKVENNGQEAKAVECPKRGTPLRLEKLVRQNRTCVSKPH